MVSAKQLRALISRTYIIAIGVIALLTTIFFAYNHYLLQSLDLQPTVINIAGKQRMLSQRIALLHTSIYYESNEAKRRPLKNELKALALMLATDHERLIGSKAFDDGSHNRLTNELDAHYFGDRQPLDIQVKLFAERAVRIAESRPNTPIPPPPTYEELKELLSMLDTSVRLFEQNLTNAITDNRQFSFMVYLLILTAMLLSVFKLFKPLENLVFKHYREATDARFDASRQRAQASAAAKAKAEFLTRMSHELRSPLAAVIGALELLPHSQTRQADLISKAEHSCYRLLHLSGNLIDSMSDSESHPTSGVDTFDLVKVIDDAVGPFVYQARQKELHLSIKCQGTLPRFVCGPAEAISKALKNLVDNAIKYTEFGEVIIKVSVKPERRRLALRITVSDTGPGIPEAEQDTIFNPFVQGQYAADHHISGMGIGLSVARHQITSHGGSLTVEGRQIRGSRFVLTMPLKEAAPLATRPQSTPVGTVRFAIIDDMEISRLHLANIITGLGYEVDTFASGTELLTRQDNISQYKALILDFFMPGLSGAELSANLQTMYADAVPPIIFVSATPAIANLASHTRLPVWQTFVKPIDQERFADAIRHLATDTQPVQTTRQASVLIVEDEPINRELMQNMLTTMNFNIKAAANGEEALTLCQRQQFDVILLDINLPDFSGIEVARRLRQQGCAATMVAVTANAFETDKEATRAAHIRYHLVKPVSYQELYNTIRQALLPG
ncbi:response regulator [Salinimonas lutimaris]|uniref:response regulator n=1 Tax=Salinimonas lutimaris TaxID=914153 RepID=UPI0010C04982|nr:response regulator [Salinimonas lutimaris]